MKTLLIAIIVMLHVAMLVSASEDMQLAFRTVEYNLNTSNSVVVGVDYLFRQASFVIGPRRLARIELEWDGALIVVPTNILAHITNPRLETVDIRAGVYCGDVNSNASYRVVDIRFEDPRTPQHPRLVKARFLFWGGKFQELDIDDATVLKDGAEEFTLWGESHQTIESILDSMQQYRLRLQENSSSDPFLDGATSDDKNWEAANTDLHGSTESRELSFQRTVRHTLDEIK